MKFFYKFLRCALLLAAIITIPSIIYGALPDTTTVNGTHLYKLNLAISTSGYQSTYYITPSSPKVSIKDNPGANELWYILETNDTPTGTFERDHIDHYCYIVNAVSGQYLYYIGTNSNNIETNVVEMKDINANGLDNDRFKFIIKRSGNSSTYNCWMFPKIAAENNQSNSNSSNLWESNSWGNLTLGVPQGSSYANGLTLSKERNGVWSSQWVFVSSSLLAAPTITFNNETNSFSISHSTLTSGCTIYYTLDGSTPSTTSNAYSEPVFVETTETVKAVVIRDNDNILLTEVGSLEVEPVDIVAPTVTNTYDGYISLSTTTPGATIYYTTNGDTPDDNSTKYEDEPFALGDATVIKAIAYIGSDYSDVTTYNVPKYTTPTVSFDNSTSEVTITCTGATGIYYTTDGSTPTTSSTSYSEPFTVNSTTTVKAIATHAGYLTSDVAELPIIFQCATPVITKTSATTFTIECSYPTSGVTIYYNTGDGSQEDPTDESYEYLGEVTFDENNLPFTVKAIAYADDYDHSTVASLTIEAVHDYSKDYLTFNVLTDGTISWKAFNNLTKTIEYSIDNGTWTNWVSTSDGATIDVQSGNHVRLRGTAYPYATSKSAYSGFEGGTATFDIEGNIHSLIYGDNFADNNTLPNNNYIFCSLFKKARVISAENLILPATTLKTYCYRALFSWCTTLTTPPALPATTLAQGCYWYMFEQCAITTAPELNATTLVNECYGHMFEGCSNLNEIKCLATTGFDSSNCLADWVKSVSASGTFVKEIDVAWSSGASGIPSGWDIYDAEIEDPVINFDGEFVTITCQTYGASIYYRLGETGDYSLYSAPIVINESTMVEAYAVKSESQSNVVSEYCNALKKFAGMKITPGPLYYGSNGYEIKDGWNYDSYNSVYGKTVGSTYFNFIELGQLFESSVFSTSDGDIEKVLDPLDGWRVPTNAEWASILGTTRSGSTVNETPDMHYAMIQLEDVSGLLIFPDGETITGVALSNMDNTTPNDISESDLNEYLSQGCVFLPGSGFYDGDWNSGNYYWSSTENDSSTGYVSSGENKNKESYYFPVYLVKGSTDEATKLLKTWTYNNNEVELPYSVNAIDGHSASYARGIFYFTTDVKIKELQPTYLWFQHADQSADIYVDNVKVTTHWGGYTSFFVDITNYVHVGVNNIKVALCNTKRNTLAPYTGDFNMNATLGEVKLISSPVVPNPNYGYDGFHITSTVTAASATITVKTKVPTGATLTCSIKGTNCNYSSTQTSTGEEITFTTSITDPHLWNGTLDPYLYDVTLTIAKDGVVYHTFKRGYGLRFYEYVIDGETPANSRFYLNGSPYLLRGVCMHHDLEGKANALTAADIDNDFELLKELGCNFVRLAHYPHPKEVYDWCDKMGIIVQTEAPCVNDFQSTLPQDYYDHLYIQYDDMVRQHFNHPCIMFWGLGNEIKTDDTSFSKTKLEAYRTFIKAIDAERWVGYVVDHGKNNPSSSFGNPEMDWFGCNIYVGWYIDKTINDPTNQLNTRVSNIITNLHKPLAFSEYGCGGTPSCHSDNYKTTTTTGNNPRHDIEYQMWLHEGHIAAIKNFPQLLFTSQWQLFDIAVYNRVEGYKVCKDGEETSVYVNLELQRLNNKGLVERDHKTKKDTYYLYKAWWNETDKFVHICGKDYKKRTDRVIKCYTNDGSTLTLYVNDEEIQTVTVTNNIATFTKRDFNSGDVIRVNGATSDDTFTINNYNVFKTAGDWDEASNWSAGAVPAAGCDVDIVASATVPSDYTANAGNITLYGSSTLTIEDGGQLIMPTTSTGVQATVKKETYAATAEAKSDYYWFAISSAVANPSISSATNIASGTYDFYRYNEAKNADLPWENYKNTAYSSTFTTLERGRGYLYRNDSDLSITMTGEVNVENFDYPVTKTGDGVLAGFNLIGNPYSHDIYKGEGTAIPNGDEGFLRIGFYYMEPTTGKWTLGTDNGTAIKPNEAIFVQTDANGNITMTNTNANGSSKSNNEYIMFKVANSQYSDETYAWFDKGRGLNKISHRNDEIPMLYINQEDEDYAIATMNDDTKTFSLNFKAMTTGKYTLSYKTKGAFRYLHVIDKVTGEDIDMLFEGEYSFVASPIDSDARFIVCLEYISNDDDTDSSVFAYQSGNNIIVSGEGELQIFDVMGRLVARQYVNGIGTWHAVSVQTGVYIFKLNEKTQKILIR